MSVSSCEVDGCRSTNGGDFCCTEEELFESFMEIVNDPKLQEGASDQEEADVKQSINALNTSVSDDTTATQSLNEEGEGNEITGDHQSLKDQVENIEHSGNPNQASPPENVDNEAENGFNDLNNTVEPAGENLPDIKNDNLDSQNIEKDQSANLQSNNSSEILTVEENEQHETGDLKQNDQSSLEQQPSNKQVNQSNAGFTSTQQSPDRNKAEVISSILLRQPTSPRNESKTEGSTFVLPPNNRNEVEIVSSILLKQPTSPRKVKEEQLASSQQETNQSDETVPTDQRAVGNNQSKAEVSLTNESEAEVSSTNEGEAEVSSTNKGEVKVNLTNEGEAEVSSTNEGEAEVSSTDQGEAEVSSTNEGEAEVSLTNEGEAEVSSTNEGEAAVSSTDQGGANVSSTTQSELQESIEEGIRKANQVCEELNALTRKMSQSSDELLGDGDTDLRKADRNSLRREPGVVSNGESTQNDDNNLISDSDSNTQIKDESTSQRPMSLPKLKVTNQSSSPISPNLLSSPKGTTTSPLQTTPSPSIESSTSPMAISPSSISFLKDEERDRKSSVSDSLDSSEGSLGERKSLGASPSPNQGHAPFNWDILNTALADNDTDDDVGVYESSGGYGGFGLVLDDDPPLNELATPDDGRQRSVSQSSTASEAQFQQEYRKKHSTGSLERNIGKSF